MSFLSARDARSHAIGFKSVADEITLIDAAIASAVENGSFEAIIGPSSTPAVETGLSNSAVHTQAYISPVDNNTDSDRKARLQLKQVLSNFSIRGFNITIKRVGETDTFDWVVKW